MNGWRACSVRVRFFFSITPGRPCAAHVFRRRSGSAGSQRSPGEKRDCVVRERMCVNVCACACARAPSRVYSINNNNNNITLYRRRATHRVVLRRINSACAAPANGAHFSRLE